MFLDLSYGYRPGRNCHDTLKELNRIIEKGKTNYVVEADIRGYFDHVDHSWLMKFIEHKIKDPNIKRYIVRFLKAGIMEEGKFRVKRKTAAKKFREKIKAFQDWIKEVRHNKADDIMKKINAKLIGHYRYYGITDNREMLRKFRQQVIMNLFKWLNRRSQRLSFNFERFQELILKRYKLPYPRIYVNIYG